VGTTDPAIFTGFVRVITKRKLSEAALTAARDEAERAEPRQERIPLPHEPRAAHAAQGILGFAQILEMKRWQGQPAPCVTHILKAGRHLLSLINEVLDLSGIEAGRVTFSIEPGAVARFAREAARSRAASRRLA
jgi:signal transduction histidine kinase